MTPAVTLLGERYELLDVIGAGGFCEVWRAHDHVLDRQVAVKLLDAKYARDSEALARFRAEAQNAGCLTHVNIARVYDFGEPGENNLPFLVMELVEGPTLADLLADGPLEPARAMDIVAQAAAGLQAAHAAGLVHRDIKPGNLLLGPAGIVKVADFGISHTVDSTPMTCTGIVIGSPGYVAPERASGARASQSSDLYALGVVAYECLTGAPPFEGIGLEVALAHLNRPFPALPPSVPPGIAALVARLTDKDPANRPATAGLVAEHALLLRHQPPPAPVPSLVPSLVPAAAPAAGSDGADAASTSAYWAAARLSGPVRSRPARSGPVLTGVGHAARTMRSRAGSTGWHIVVAVAAAISGLGIFLAAGINDPSSAHQISRSSPINAQLGQTGDAVVQTVTVPRSLIGQPVSRVVSRLRHKGLAVYVIWRRASGHRPGRVLTVRPLGRHRVHTTVVVIGVRAPRHHRSVRWHPAGRAMDAPGHRQQPPRPHGPGPGPGPGKHPGHGDRGPPAGRGGDSQS